MQRKFIRNLAFAAAFFAALVIVGCGSSYRFSSLKNKGEKALRARDYEKAKDCYSLIYQKEKEAEEQKFENLAWAYYRLGVIHELMGDTKLAKGYYWGDSVKEGFYSKDAKVEWLAKTGWKWLDQNNPPRILKEILELELRSHPPGKQVVRQKKEVQIRKRDFRSSNPVELPKGTPTRVFNRSLTPPPPSTPEPFRIYY